MTSSWKEAEETDTSDEEVKVVRPRYRFSLVCNLCCFSGQEIRNTIGNIPLEWYDDYPHIGYDIEGRPRPKPVTADEVGVAIFMPILLERTHRITLACLTVLVGNLCTFLCSLMSFCPRWMTLTTGGLFKTRPQGRRWYYRMNRLMQFKVFRNQNSLWPPLILMR